VIHAEFWFASPDGETVEGWAGELYAAGSSVRLEGEWLEEQSDQVWLDPACPRDEPPVWLTVDDGESWAREVLGSWVWRNNAWTASQRIRAVVLADSHDPALRDRIAEFAVCYRYALPDAAATELDAPALEPLAAVSEES
jgi:hypothetical protein